MIQKIIELRGIGLLHEPLPQGAIELNKLTAIYAENGRGKSTFACICRCLAQNDSIPLLARRTIRGTYEPAVELRINGQNYKFENGSWNNACPSILVFDSEFVDRNVCSGNRLEPEHRENLLEFVLGERGVILKNEIDQITEEIKSLNQQIREKSGVIDAYAKPFFTVDDFVGLPPDLEINQKLLETQKMLNDAKNATAIQNRPEFSAILLPEIEIGEIERLLRESIDTIAEDAERRVQEHIQQSLDEYGEQWIRQGLRYMKNDKCPFCAQNLSGAEIIKAYKGYFDESYENFKRQIGEMKKEFITALAETKLDEVQRVVANDEIARAAWNDRTEIAFPPPLDQEGINTAWRELRRALEDILQRKADSPLTRLEFTEEVYNAVAQYEQLKRLANCYNEEVTRVNEALRSIKNTVGFVDLTEITQKLSKLTVQQKRWGEDVKNTCEAYTALKVRKEQLESEKATKRAQLNQYTDELLDRYEDTINRNLQMFNAGFSIEKITTEHVGGTPRTAYRLRVMGEVIPVSQRSGSVVGPSFSNTLSDGDKRTLALAFFLAKIQTDPDLASKVAIIDDPVSSFDIHRQRATLAVLKDLARECAQLVVLSHNAYFIRDIEQKAGDNALVLQIRRRGNYSIFDSCVIDSICQSEYYANYFTLTQYLEKGATGNLRDIAKAIRPYLEGNLHSRFPIELQGAKNLGGIIQKIRESEEGDPLSGLKPQLEALSQINEFASPFMHAESPEDFSVLLTDAELKSMVELALKIGRGG